MLISDFDGTLAPFCTDPEDVTLNQACRRALTRWLDVPSARVVVISGRSLADLTPRLPHQVTCVGSHGLEFADACGASADWDRAAVYAWLQSTLGDLPVAWQQKPHGIGVNLRGMQPQARAEAERRLTATCPVPGVRTLRGHAIFEYFAAQAPDKGDAARKLLHSLDITEHATVVIGDDTTDEAMFTALPDAWTVRVGDAPTGARYRLAGQPQVGCFLEQIAAGLTSRN